MNRSTKINPGGSHTAHQLHIEKPINESLVYLHASPTEKKDSFDLQTSPLRMPAPQVTGKSIHIFTIILKGKE